MTHDPLCTCSHKDHEHFFYMMPADVCMACKCDDIARVRADEREKAAQRIEAIAPEQTDRTNLVVLAFAMACDAARGEAS